jgi:addiction module HigA family antidote
MLKSLITTEENSMAKEIRLPIHRPPTTPGELLARVFLPETGMTITAFAAHIGIGRDRLSEIIHGRRRLLIEVPFRNSVQFWLNAQAAIDLYEAQLTANVSEIEKIRPVFA